MEKIKFIVNPNSGREAALNKISMLTKLYSKDKAKLLLNFTGGKDDAYNFAKEDDGEDIIVCVGGDGTVNEVANGIYYSENKDRPLAILQAGTVNDFANHLKLPTNPKKFYEMLKKKKTIKADLGLAGDRIFVNVAAGGHLTDIAYNVSDDTKAKLGSLAYYLEGAKEFIKMSSSKGKFIEVDVKSEEFNSTEKILVFVVANSASVGGFKKLMPRAEVFDGYLDVLMVKDITAFELPDLLGSFLSGNQHNHDKVIYLKTKEIEFKSKKDIIIDLDGENAGDIPMKFKVLEKALTLVVN